MKRLLIICAAALCFCANAATQLTLNDGDTLTGEFADATVTIAAGATVTFNGASLTNTTCNAPAVKCLGNATIVLAEGSDNSVVNMVDYYSAIYPAADATLTIQGSGSLYVAAPGIFFKNYGAAIGSYSSGSDNTGTPCGNIVIAGGNITAVGGYCGAGVGACSYDAACGDITITGDAVVHATGGEWAAGIGAASDRSPCGNITISGNASVMATSTAYYGANSAGIGAGYDSACGNITVSTTGTVEAQGLDAAGIGAGGTILATCAGITITSGIITATGGSDACAIGASFKAGCGDILIEGGTITATGGEDCPGVGALGETASITITGGNVTAIGGSNGSRKNGGAGIGSMYYRTCGNITISGGTVTATGGAWAAGIGSGYEGTCSNITISAGMVTANVCTSTGDGETDTVAIGAGCCGTCGNILISGGTVVANATNPQNASKDFNSAIGATYYNSKCGDITITDGITSVTATKGATAEQHIGKGNGTATIGTITYGSHLKQTLSNDDLTVTVEPNWVEIGNVTEFNAIANDLTGWYKLTADIDLQNVQREPFGAFSGVLDGNGHTISNINIVRTGYSNGNALFYSINNAVVRNLTLENGSVRVTSNYKNATAGIAGYAFGTNLIENCTVDLTIEGAQYLGGFVGSVYEGCVLTIRRCRSFANITSSNGDSRVGGFVGDTYNANVLIEDSYFAGAIKGGYNLGGLVGHKNGSGTLAITNCYHSSIINYKSSGQPLVGNGDNLATITGDPTVIDSLPKGGVRVGTIGTGTGTATYVNGEIVATPAAGSFVVGTGEIPSGEFNDVKVFVTFGKEIATLVELKAVANDLSGFYRLTADIDLANEEWRLGTFTGIFDGNGHTISNINCNNPWDYSGLFYALGDGAVVRSLSLRGGMVTTYNGSIGGLAGRVSGNVLVEDCTIDVLVSSSAGGTVGGFVGYVSNATLTLRRCRSLSAVVCRYDRVGGLVGYPYGSAVVTVEDCYAAGSVKGTGWVGGIVGCPDGGGNSLLTISNSYSVAELTGNFGSADERVGELNSRVVIIDTPTILDNFPTNIVNVRTRGTGAGTASYDAETGEFTATPDVGSVFYGWEGLPPKEGDYNERTVWAVFGRPVATASDFNNMDAGGIYVQTADIDLAGESGAIGYNGVFTGCYNGGNHEIRNMVKNGGYYSHGGLFSQMDGAVVKNLRIMDANVTGGNGTAVLAGYAVKSTIENVRVEGGSVKGSGNNIGGLVGQASSGLFEECMSSATVEGNEALGGLVGHGGGSITVRRSYATGDVTGSRYAGGFIGNGDYINFTDCYALGAVTATNSGYYAGGFIAGDVGVWNAYFAFTNCYSVGAVSGASNSGGFDSSERYSQRGCTNCYWDAEASGKNSSYVSGVTGLTTAEMKSGTAFEGWDTTVWKFAEGQYPRLRAFIPKYTVTWLDEDGSTVLGESVIDEGDTPTCEAPTKAATAQYTYTFAGWTPAVTPVESNTTYTATYDATVNEYEITWLSDDDSVIDTTSVAYGDTPALDTPTKAATAQYTYEFAGWTPAVVAVTGTATYKATFTPVLRSYTVTWKDADGTTLGTDTVAYGSTPSRADPSKAATAQYTYAFTGWSPAVAAVTGEATYTATYSETVNTYTITWLDYDGTTLKTETLAYGATPTCATPSRADDTYSTYTFLEWMPAVASVTGEATYEATYMMHSKWTGQGTVYEPYTLTTPERISEIITLDEGSSSEIYVNVGNGITSESITANLPTGYAVRTTGTADVVKVVQILEVVWYDDDGTVLRRDEVDAGDMPAYGGDPTKASTAQYEYTFAGWTPEIVAVTESASYTATYNESLRSYTITWLDADGTPFATTTVDYGETPSHYAPTSAYTFTGWDPTPVPVTGEATYTATYSPEVVLNNLTGDYTAANGDVLTGTTAHKVTIPGGVKVKFNNVEIEGAGGGTENPVPEFGGVSAVTKFVQTTDGKWTITTFAELDNEAVGTDVANNRIKVYAADSIDGLDSASPIASGVEVKEKKSAVKTTLEVTPPDPTAAKQFFKVVFE